MTDGTWDELVLKSPVPVLVRLGRAAGLWARHGSGRRAGRAEREQPAWQQHRVKGPAGQPSRQTQLAIFDFWKSGGAACRASLAPASRTSIAAGHVRQLGGTGWATLPWRTARVSQPAARQHLLAASQ